MLKVGDHITDPLKHIWRVIERHGSGKLYSVKIEPVGWKLPFKKCDWLQPADWWMNHGWSKTTMMSDVFAKWEHGVLSNAEALMELLVNYCDHESTQQARIIIQAMFEKERKNK